MMCEATVTVLTNTWNTYKCTQNAVFPNTKVGITHIILDFKWLSDSDSIHVKWTVWSYVLQYKPMIKDHMLLLCGEEFSYSLLNSSFCPWKRNTLWWIIRYRLIHHCYHKVSLRHNEAVACLVFGLIVCKYAVAAELSSGRFKPTKVTDGVGCWWADRNVITMFTGRTYTSSASTTKFNACCV